jgi:hypothetical protein
MGRRNDQAFHTPKTAKISRHKRARPPARKTNQNGEEIFFCTGRGRSEEAINEPLTDELDKMTVQSATQGARAASSSSRPLQAQIVPMPMHDLP